MPSYKISEIAEALSSDYLGNGDVIVLGIGEPESVGPDQLAIAMTKKYRLGVADCAARAAVLWPSAEWQEFNLDAAIFVERPRLAMSILTNLFRSKNPQNIGIHPTALVDPSVEIGDDTAIGAYSILGANVQIGANVTIGSHVSIGQNVVLGNGSILRDGVKIGDDVRIGERFVAQSGVSIGFDGFSYVTIEKSHVENVRRDLQNSGKVPLDQRWQKIQSIGGVEIADDVELGANSNIDAGTIRPTKIGAGTKIDALVQIGHNVVIGENCLLCSQVGVAGSSIIGDSVVLGGKAGVADNISIGDGVVAGAGSIILSNVPAGRAVLGYPATKMDRQIESYKALRRLPRLIKAMNIYKNTVSSNVKND